LGLDETQFKKQQQNPTATGRIRQDYEEGIRLGVRGTPTIFINGKKLRDRSMKSMETTIEKELQKSQEKSQKETAQ
jgi:protein-disulfide isomerase